MFWSKKKSKEEDMSSHRQSIVGISSTSNNSTTEDVEARIEAKLLKQMKKEMSQYEKDAITKAEIIFSEKYNVLERSINDKLRQAQLYQNDNDISIASEYPTSTMSTRSSMINHDSPRIDYKNQDLSVVEDGATDANYEDLFDDHTQNNDQSGREPTPYSARTNYSKDHDEVVEVPLPHDSYSIMMTSNPFSFPWLFAFGVFLLQAGLFAVVLLAQLQGVVGSAHFNIPVKVQLSVLIGQALAILVVFAIQDDIIDSIKISTIFLTIGQERDKMLNSINLKKIVQNSGEEGQLNDVDYSANAKAYWNMNTMRVLLPCILKLLVGLSGMGASFFIVVSSEDTISLFKDFAALGMISFVDDVAFKLCADGMFGTLFVKKTEEVQKITLKRQRLKKRKIPLQTIFSATVIVAVFTGWAVIVIRQNNGRYFYKKYPECVNNNREDISLRINNVEDNVCDKWANKIECGFDGGDCLNFNMAFPNCEADFPSQVGDRKCQEKLVTKDCGYDRGDCCQKFLNITSDAEFAKVERELGDAKCNQDYNVPQCQYDNYDCAVEGFPDCHIKSPGADPKLVKNRVCNEIFDTKECGFDGGDCLHPDFPDCKVSNAVELLSNGICDQNLAIPECDFDNGACKVFDGTSDEEKKRIQYPDCRASNTSIIYVENGICEGGELNVGSCEFDGGDCAGFNENFTFPCIYNASFDAYMKNTTSSACEDSFSYQPLGEAISGIETKDKAGASVDLSADGLTMAIGSRNHNGNAGNVRVFSFSIADGAWKKLGNDINGLGRGDLSGQVSVSDNGSIIAVGARGGNDASSLGYVRIFSLSYVNGTDPFWEQMGPQINGTQGGDKFGFALDLGSDGKTILIGSPYHDVTDGTDSGVAKVYIFSETDNNWIQKGDDIYGSDESVEMTFSNGLALSADGSIIALGSHRSSDSGKNANGKVDVYHYDGIGEWVSMASFIGQESNDYFGESLDLSHDGHTLAAVNNGQKQVQVYSFDTSNSKWQQTGTINVLGSDFFITKLALSSSGDALVVGSPKNNGKDGSDQAGRIKVYVYYQEQAAWVEVEDLSGASGDEFGSDVAINESGCIVASGARKSDIEGAESGSATVFSLCQ